MKQTKNSKTFIIVIILFLFICTLPTLLYPFGRDQGIFAYIGNTIIEGGVPYRDGWEVKPPGIYFIYALAFRIFGKSMLSIRLFELIYTLITIIFICRLGNLLYGKTVGLLAGFLFWILYFLSNDFWNLSQPDGFLILPMVLSIYTASKAKKNNSIVLWFLCGIFMAGVFLLRLEGILLIIPLTYIALNPLDNKGREIKKNLPNLFYITLGFFLPSIIILIYFAKNHALGDLIYIVFNFNSHFYRWFVPMQIKTRGIYITLSPPGFCIKNLVVVAPAIIAILRIKRKENNPNDILTILWLAVVVSGVLIHFAFVTYHWLSVLAPLSILGAHGLVQLFKDFSWSTRRLFLKDPHYQFMIIIIFFFLLYPTRDYLKSLPHLYDYLTDKISLQKYYGEISRRYGSYNVWDFSIEADLEVASYLKNNTSPDDTIFIWGFEPIIYFLSDRKCPSKYISIFPIIANWNPRFKECREELINDLSTKHPKYFLIVEEDTSWVYPHQDWDSMDYYKRFPELIEIVTRDFIFDKKIEHFHLHKEKKNLASLKQLE